MSTRPISSLIAITLLFFLLPNFITQCLCSSIPPQITGHYNTFNFHVVGSDIEINGVMNIYETSDAMNITFVIPYGADQVEIHSFPYPYNMSIIKITKTNNETRVTYKAPRYGFGGLRSLDYSFRIKNVVHTSQFRVYSLSLKTPYIEELDKVSLQLWGTIESIDAIIVDSNVRYDRWTSFRAFAWARGYVYFREDWWENLDFPHGVKEMLITWTYNPLFSYLVGLNYTSISIIMFSLGQFIQLFLYSTVKLFKRQGRELARLLVGFLLPIPIYLLIAPITLYLPHLDLSLDGIGQYYHIPFTFLVAKILAKRVKLDVTNLSTISSIISGTILLIFIRVMLYIAA